MDISANALNFACAACVSAVYILLYVHMVNYTSDGVFVDMPRFKLMHHAYTIRSTRLFPCSNLS